MKQLTSLFDYKIVFLCYFRRISLHIFVFISKSSTLRTLWVGFGRAKEEGVEIKKKRAFAAVRLFSLIKLSAEHISRLFAIIQ